VFGLVEKKVRHKTPTYQALVVCFGTTMLAIAVLTRRPEPTDSADGKSISVHEHGMQTHFVLPPGL
jgi:hypothetical protein